MQFIMKYQFTENEIMKYLLSGDSSPSNLILNLIPTGILRFFASRYLLTLTTNSDWLVLGTKKIDNVSVMTGLCYTRRGNKGKPK
jgi:hypothetical protein